MYRIDHYDNDLTFVCYIIEEISRTTLNTRKDVVNKLGRKNLSDLYKFANVMHCENPLAIIDEFIVEANITVGNFDNVKACKFELPWGSTIGKIYMRLILNTLPIACNWKDYETNIQPELVIDNIIAIYNSWISEIIDDYNTTMFTESARYIYDCYNAKEILG